VDGARRLLVERGGERVAIESIELGKGPDASAPVVMAVTLEAPEAK
jgi:hypothetical protein